MTLPAILNALLGHNHKRLAQGIEHGNGSGVVIAVRNGRVVMNQLQIQIPTTDWSGAAA